MKYRLELRHGIHLIASGEVELHHGRGEKPASYSNTEWKGAVETAIERCVEQLLLLEQIVNTDGRLRLHVLELDTPPDQQANRDAWNAVLAESIESRCFKIVKGYAVYSSKWTSGKAAPFGATKEEQSLLEELRQL